MKTTVLGCGNAFSKKSLNQAFLCEEDGRKLLIDCGFTTGLSLERAGVKMSEIDDIYLSHQHSDHIGGLEEMAFTRYNFINRPRNWKEQLELRDAKFPNIRPFPRLIGYHELLRDTWDRSLRGGLESVEGFVAGLDTFFEPVPLPSNGSFTWQGWLIRLVEQVHVVSGYHIMHAYGLMMSKDGHPTIYMTTDTQFNSPQQASVFYKEADVIFQDCETMGVDMVAKKYDFGSHVHASYAELAGYDGVNNLRLDAATKAKMVLSHYHDHVLVNRDYKGGDVDWEKRVVEDGFKGLVRYGQVFDF